MAKEVERGPLCGQYAPRWPLDDRDQIAGRDRVAILPLGQQPNSRVNCPERHSGQLEPSHYPGLPRDQGGSRPLRRWYDRIGGDIAGAAKILGQRRANKRLEENRWQRGNSHYSGYTRGIR